jgi:arylsulfatase
LAEQGARYNRFHTTAVCSATRAALLTGRNAHRVGAGDVIEFPRPGYDWSWPRESAPVARILQRNGYNTAAFGKWHNTPLREVSPIGPFDRWPTGLGFQHFYGFMQGEDSQWEPLLYRDTTAVDRPAAAGDAYHFTTDITNEAIRWLHTQRTLAPDHPYFLYFATGAAHAPHHVAPEWIAKYKGRFDGGWDRLREEIFARQKRMGLIPQDAELTPRPDALPAWDSLSPEARRLYARQMEVFAGFLEQTDHEITRLVNEIRAAPGGENTAIFYIVGDNGGSGEGAVDGSDVGLANIIFGVPSTVAHQSDHIDELGSAAIDNHYSAAWAWATSTPFRWMKRVASAFGGTRNPLIVSWPGHVKAPGEIRSQFAHVNDIVPTIYEISGISAPQQVDGISQTAFDGVSLAYTFQAPAAPSHHRRQYFEQGGNRAMYKDGWIATARRNLPWKLECKPDFSTDVWKLYNIDKDFSEMHDLASAHPERLAELKDLFDQAAKDNNVLPLNDGCIVKTAGQAVTGAGNSGEKAVQRTLYHPDIDRLPVSKSPNLSGSFTIRTTIDTAGGRAEGVLLTSGSRYGGLALYVRNRRLVFESNWFTWQHDRLDAPLPAGTARIELRVDRARTGPHGGGTVALLIDGKVAAERRFAEIGVPDQFGSFGIGRSYGGPVSANYEGSFPFSGKLSPVEVSVR